MRADNDGAAERSKEYGFQKENETNETFLGSGDKTLKDKVNESTVITHRDSLNYKDDLETLRNENKRLKQELQNTSNIMKRSTDLRDTSQPFETIVENTKYQMTEGKKAANSEAIFKILTEVSRVVGAENIITLVPKIKEIQEESKTNQKFVSSFLDLVYKCSPSGYFENKPTVQQAWKWMKRLMQEYMDMRKEGKSDASRDSDLIHKIMICLAVKNKDDLMDKVRWLASENSLMAKVINKMKTLYNIEWSVPLGELDKRLEMSLTTNGRMTNKLENRCTNLPLKMSNS